MVFFDVVFFDVVFFDVVHDKYMQDSSESVKYVPELFPN